MKLSLEDRIRKLARETEPVLKEWADFKKREQEWKDEALRALARLDRDASADRS